MKNILFIIIFVFLFIGCSNKSKMITQTEKEDLLEFLLKEKTLGNEELDKFKDSYNWVMALIEKEAQKYEVMVDAFELQNVEVMDLSPANKMNGWESKIKLKISFAVKENAGSTWYDLDSITYITAGGNKLPLGSSLSYVVSKVKGNYGFIGDYKGLDNLISAFIQKNWIEI